MIKIDETIFKDYDIRGIYPTSINEDTYYLIGRSIVRYLKVNEIAVGRDTRLSSPSLFKNLVKGITDEGADVVDLGLISTEIHYFASGKYGFPANVIVSASHNPPQYNGLKIVTRGVVPLHGGFGLPEIKNLTLKQEFKKPVSLGHVTSKSILNEWISHALDFIKIDDLNKLKVVVDAGNGMGGISWQKLIGKLGSVEIIPLFFEPDGHFPNHLPDPLKDENMKFLRDKVKETNADLGIALDGDADRMFMVDNLGRNVSGTITTAILAEALLKKKGPNPVLYNAVCGRVVPEIIKKYSGRPVRVRVGHSFIKGAMKKENALFAGEHSGHFYFRDDFFADSSLIAGLLVLEYLSNGNMKLSDIVNKLNKYPASPEINFKVENPLEILDKVESSVKNPLNTDRLDGLSVWFEDWWFNLRSSKTEPYVRLNIEADDKELLEEKVKEVKNLLTDLGAQQV